MHEDSAGGGHGHDLLVDLIGGQQADALGPHAVGLTHADPDIGVDHVGVGCALGHILGEGHAAAGLPGDVPGLLHQPLLGEQLLGSAGGEVHTHLGAGHHQGVAHVVARIAEIGEAHALQSAQLLLDGQQVRQHLGGVELVGEAVPHGHARMVGQLLHQVLAEAAVLDAVIHPAQHPGGVGDGLLLAHLAAAGLQIRHAHAQVHTGHLEGAPGPGGGLFKQQHDVLPLQPAVGHTGALHILEIFGQVQQIADLRRGVVQQLQKASASDIHSHNDVLPFY